MRLLPLFILLFFPFCSQYAQNAIDEFQALTATYDTVETKPEFAGGITGFIKYIGENFKLPEVESLSGTVKVSYIIDIDGKLKNIKIIQDLGDGTGEEAIRILKSCPPWTPGEQDGKKIKVSMQLPINLKI